MTATWHAPCSKVMTFGLATIDSAPGLHRSAAGEHETILPSQFADLLRNDEARPPEHRLMLAVLEDAIRSYQRYASASRARGRRLFREVKEWFASDDTTTPFAFVVICQTFDLEPEYVRTGLRAWRTPVGAPKRFRIRAVSGSRHQIGGVSTRPRVALRARTGNAIARSC